MLLKKKQDLRSCRAGHYEFHFIIECLALQDLRSCFFECLSYLDDSFTPLPKMEKFKYILCANNHCGIMCKHLHNMYKTRCNCLNLYPFVIIIRLIFLYYNLVTHRSNQAGHFL